jgi:hypothetical protein
MGSRIKPNLSFFLSPVPGLYNHAHHEGQGGRLLLPAVTAGSHELDFVLILIAKGIPHDRRWEAAGNINLQLRNPASKPFCFGSSAMPHAIFSDCIEDMRRPKDQNVKIDRCIVLAAVVKCGYLSRLMGRLVIWEMVPWHHHACSPPADCGRYQC